MNQVAALSLEELQKEYARLITLTTAQENVISTLKHQLHLFRTARFGRKSEKGVVPEQMALQFDEAVPVVEEEIVSSDAKETITYTRAKKGMGRKALPQSLPYVEEIHDLTDAQKQCACGCTMTHIRDEVTEQLDVVPQMTFRVVHIRKQYACKQCEESIKLAPLPKHPIEKSIATPGLLAAVINSKFRCHMPLYRQETMFHEAGISITRGTLSNWMIKAADLLTPLVKLMEYDIQNYDIAYADETPLQVLKEKGRLPTQKSTMWLFIGGPPEKRAFVYQYHQTRGHQIPYDFFVDFKGYLHADCYKAYVALGMQDHIQHVACLAHARRYFVDVAKQSKKEGLAHKILKLIAACYHIESELKDNMATILQIFETRLQKSAPILAQINSLLEDAKLKVPPKSPLGQAIFYSLSHWEALIAFLKDGRLEIDNNRSERAIKPFVIGRKNWLFHGNDIGARAGAILFSLIETCKNHQIDVFSWLKLVLAKIPLISTADELEKLLPYNIETSLLQDMRSLPKLIF